MGKHPSFVKGWNGSLDDLTKSIGNRSYDEIGIFLEKLANDLEKQSKYDLSKERKKTYTAMTKVVKSLYESREHMTDVWKICEPYTEKYDSNSEYKNK